MRIVIDLQGAQSTGSRSRGIGRYSASLCEAIVRNRGEHEVVLALNAVFPETIDVLRRRFGEFLPQKNIVTFDSAEQTRQLTPENEVRRIASEHVREAFLASLQPDVVHVSSLFEGLDDDAVVSIAKHTSLPTAVTLYDLIPLINREIYLSNRVVHRWYSDRLDNLRRADHLLSISASARDEAIRNLGFGTSDVTNVGTAADPQFVPSTLSPTQTAELLRKYSIRPRFVMYTGGIDHRKNLDTLIDAYASLPGFVRAETTLAIVCSCQDLDRRRLMARASACGLTGNDFVMTGYVPEEDLIGLYGATSLFVFPSWHEGFGLPALEAMHCGAPVIGSNRSSLPEVIGLEAAMFDPFSADEIRGVLERGLTDEHYRKLLISNGARQGRKFSWDKSAKLAIAALEKVARRSDRAVPRVQNTRTRPTLAYVSPLPPQKSGIATYSAELLPELSRHYDIECIVPDDYTIAEDLHDEIGAYIKLRKVGDFLRNSADFERVLYHIGNSEFHAHMFGMLEEVPGVVVQHDFFLSGVLSYLESHDGIRNLWSESLYRSHGYRALQVRFAPQGFMDALWKYPSNRQVVEGALGIIVHSPSTRTLARKWLPKSLADPISVIPHMRVIPPKIERDAARKALQIGKDDFVVCSFGIMGETKLSRRLLECWLASRTSERKTSRLIFVGQPDAGEYGAGITERIANSDRPGRVTITGWVDDDLYRLYLEACDVAVQLRTRSRGETSGTILDCMAYGKAAIINAHGSAADLPSDGVIMLEDQFSDDDLTHSLEELFDDPSGVLALGTRAQKVIREQHSPRRCAEEYARAIESFYRNSQATPLGLARALTPVSCATFDPEDQATFAKIICNAMPPPEEDLLYIDVSDFEGERASSVHAVLEKRISEEERRVEPVRWLDQEQHFVAARRLTLEALRLQSDILGDAEPVSFVRNTECLVLSRDQGSAEVARGRWASLAAQFNISCTFEDTSDESALGRNISRSSK